jgi:Lon protease-like protein
VDVFVFPLVNVTLFPRTTKPLHIFEPRYIEMVEQSIAQNIPVALGFVDDPMKIQPVVPGNKLHFVRDYAGYGFAQVVEKRPQGNLLIFLHGEGKVKLGVLKKTDTPYLVCEAEIIGDKSKVLDKNLGSLQALEAILHRWILRHIPDQKQQSLFIQQITGPQEIIGCFSSYLIEDYDLQQMTLEMEDVNDRIEFLIRLVSSNRILN